MLRKREPQASVSTVSSSFPNFHECFDRNRENMFSISFRKYRDEKKKINLFYLDHQNVNYLCSQYYVNSWCHFCVSIELYTVLSQSARVFALGYFVMTLTIRP